MPQLDFSDLSSEFVQVVVGAEKKTFWVHKDLICKWSPFFHRAFNGPFEESGTKTVSLADDEPAIFQFFLNYIYRGCIFEPITPDEEKLCKLWIFADKIQVPALQNRVMDLLLDMYTQRMSFSATFCHSAPHIEFIYDNTAPQSYLRLLYIDALAYGLSTAQYNTLKDKLPLELVFKLSKLSTMWLKEARSSKSSNRLFLCWPVDYSKGRYKVLEFGPADTSSATSPAPGSKRPRYN